MSLPTLKCILFFSLFTFFPLSFSMQEKEKFSIERRENNSWHLIKKNENQIIVQRVYQADIIGTPIKIEYAQKKSLVLLLWNKRFKNLYLERLTPGLEEIQRNLICPHGLNYNFKESYEDNTTINNRYYYRIQPPKLNCIVMIDKQNRQHQKSFQSDGYFFGWPASNVDGLVSVIAFHKKTKKQHLLLFTATLNLLYTAQLLKRSLNKQGVHCIYDLNLIKSPE